MIAPSEPPIHAINPALQSILNQPEQVVLRRLATLVEHVFRVPIAYLALLGQGSGVATRIGSGSEYWQFLKTYPLISLLAGPTVIADAPLGLPPGTDFGDIRFAASAPLRSSAGLDLGLLVIADLQPRRGFSDQDLRALAALAEVLAGKLELRMLAAQALESELAARETEARFRAMANAAAVLIIYGGPEGGCSFVNSAWLEFTGRCLEESLGDDWAVNVHPADRGRLREAYWHAFQARQPFAAEFRMLRHDGQYRRMRGRGVPRFRNDGTFAGFVAAIVDIENERTIASELHHQKHCIEALAEAVGASYFILSPDGRIEHASEACRQSGTDFENLRGVPLWEACTAARQETSAIADAVRLVRTTGTASRATAGSQTWNIIPITPDGPEVTALVAATIQPSCGCCAGNQPIPLSANRFAALPQVAMGTSVAEIDSLTD